MTFKKLASPKTIKVINNTIGFTVRNMEKIKFVVCIALLISNALIMTSLPDLLNLPYSDVIKVLSPTVVEKVIEIPVIY